ncbi:MAG: DUF4157 domain-containing protein, partial [Symploca sp. SIO3E6]|nr:DUF4157 domain-containing protein [Caldora sp. SIO3E6]
LQLQSDEEEIQTLANPGQTPQVSPNLATKIQSRQGTGQLLPKSTRAFMEPRFGADFSTVRVHTDSSAVQMNQELGAQAFTHGGDIFYGAGKSPGNNSLTAHELTHTIQQTGGIQAKVIDSNKAEPTPNPSQGVSEKKGGERRSGGAEERRSRGAEERRKKRELIIFGYNAQEIPPKISFTPSQEGNRRMKADSSPFPIPDSPFPTYKAEGKKEGTDIQPEVEAENTVNTEVVAPQETAETAPKPETKATSVNPGETPEKNQEAMAPDAANQGIKAEVNQQTTATAAETTPQALTPVSPESDPDFQAMVAKAKGVANQQKQHSPASTKAKQAQAAAESPAKEIASKAQANQVGEMAQAPTPGFNAAAFKAKLMERIQSTTPQTLEEADEFKDSNKLASVKTQMQNQVKQEQTASQSPLEQKAKQAPDTSSIKPKSVTPLPANEAGAVTKNIGADKAIPKAKGQGEVEAPLQASSQKLDQQMAEADVTTEQLANANEPQFQTALAAKQEAQTNAHQAPQAYRQFEQNQLTQAQGEAATTADQQLQGMQGSRAQLLAQVTHQQIQAKGKDEQERTKVAGDIQQIYHQTKTQVEKILNSLDGQVNQEFDAGANQANKAFENYVDQQMKAYKDKRYSGLAGAGRWFADKLLGLPSEVNAFYQQGRQLYLAKMDVVLDRIVNIIGTALTEAKAEIAKGRQEIQEYVAQLPENLKTVGKQAATDIQSQFDELEQSVDSKQDELINTLAQKYHEKLQAVDTSIDQMKAANQGLVAHAANAITGVIDTIYQLKDMLLNVLSKAASLIFNIIKDPIGFLGNLITGIQQGFKNFVANIGQHLQAGLIGWLTGTLGPMGIQLPDDIFSLPGIFSLVTQVLGLTFTYIRGKAVKLFGEPVVAGMEKSVEIFQILRDRGAMGLWEYVKEQFNDLKQTVIEEIKNMVVTQVITAGVKWILSLLNPASAFVKAAMAIYDIIMFFINRGSQVLELVNAVVDAVAAIASGAVGGAAKLVENALAKAVPVVIGFLASLLNMGDLPKKVEKIIGKIRERIDQAIDKVLLKAKGLFKGKKGKGKGKEKSQEKADSQKLLKEVLGMVEPYENKSKKKHTLDFEQKGKQIILYRKSIPTDLREHVKNIREAISNPDPQNQAIVKKYTVPVSFNKIEQVLEKDIELQINAIEELLTDSKGKIRSTFGVEKGEKIQQALENISKALENIPEVNVEKDAQEKPTGKVTFVDNRSQARPKSKDVDFETTPLTLSDGTTSKDGKRMTAPLLSIKGPSNTSGSQPTARGRSSLWKKLREEGRDIVSAHLLNHQLFGKGNNSENLTPIPRAKNTEMEPKIEKPAKNAVFKENKVIKYVVKVIYENVNSVSKTDIDAGKQENEPGGIPEDKLIPIRIEGKLHEMIPTSTAEEDMKKPENWTKGKEIKTDDVEIKYKTDLKIGEEGDKVKAAHLDDHNLMEENEITEEAINAITIAIQNSLKQPKPVQINTLQRLIKYMKPLGDISQTIIDEVNEAYKEKKIKIKYDVEKAKDNLNDEQT